MHIDILALALARLINLSGAAHRGIRLEYGVYVTDSPNKFTKELVAHLNACNALLIEYMMDHDEEAEEGEGA